MLNVCGMAANILFYKKKAMRCSYKGYRLSRSVLLHVEWHMMAEIWLCLYQGWNSSTFHFEIWLYCSDYKCVWVLSIDKNLILPKQLQLWSYKHWICLITLTWTFKMTGFVKAFGMRPMTRSTQPWLERSKPVLPYLHNNLLTIWSRTGWNIPVTLRKYEWNVRE